MECWKNDSRSVSFFLFKGQNLGWNNYYYFPTSALLCTSSILFSISPEGSFVKNGREKPWCPSPPSISFTGQIPIETTWDIDHWNLKGKNIVRRSNLRIWCFCNPWKLYLLQIYFGADLLLFCASNDEFAGFFCIDVNVKCKF